MSPKRTVRLAVDIGGTFTDVALDAPRSWQLGNATINRLLATDSGLNLVGWADSLHLEQRLPCASSDLTA